MSFFEKIAHIVHVLVIWAYVSSIVCLWYVCQFVSLLWMTFIQHQPVKNKNLNLDHGIACVAWRFWLGALSNKRGRASEKPRRKFAASPLVRPARQNRHATQANQGKVVSGGKKPKHVPISKRKDFKLSSANFRFSSDEIVFIASDV